MVSVPWVTTMPLTPPSACRWRTAASSRKSSNFRDAPGSWRKSNRSKAISDSARPGTAAVRSAADRVGVIPPTALGVIAIVPPRLNNATRAGVAAGTATNIPPAAAGQR